MLFRHWSPLCPQRQPNCPIKCCRHMFLQTMLTYWNFAFSLCCNFTFSVLLIWVWFRLKKHLVTHCLLKHDWKNVPLFFISNIPFCRHNYSWKICQNSVVWLHTHRRKLSKLVVQMIWFCLHKHGWKMSDVLSKISAYFATKKKQKNKLKKSSQTYQVMDVWLKISRGFHKAVTAPSIRSTY